jgi:hypothetical protein
MRNRVSMVGLFAVLVAGGCGYDPHPIIRAGDGGGGKIDGAGAGIDGLPGGGDVPNAGEAGGGWGPDGGGAGGVDGLAATSGVEAGAEAAGMSDAATDKPEDAPAVTVDGSRDVNGGGNGGAGGGNPGAGGVGGVVGGSGGAGGGSGPDAPSATGGSGGGGGGGGGIVGTGGGSATDAPITTGGTGGGTGGTVATGGIVATGGTTSSGGIVATGGTATTGGNVATGGVIATGGSLGTGGAGTGGTTAACVGPSTKCAGNAVQTCTSGQWGTAVACGSNQTCSGPTGAVHCTCNTDPVCSAAGPTCANSSTLATCSQDGQGCFYQASSSTCSTGLVCERFPPAACLDPNWAEWPMPNSQADVAAGAPNLESYTDNGDLTVTDKVTGLMWQQVVDSTTTYTWAEAVAYCPTLRLANHGDWRLPSMIELLSIVKDIGQSNPSIDSTYFPSTPALSFWSSSPYPGSSTYAVEVHFGVGMTNMSYVSNRLKVRCVR